MGNVNATSLEEMDVETTKELKVLGTKRESYDGNFVLENQPIAKDKGFSHVSKIWYNKCMSYDKGMEKIVNDQQKIRDFTESPLKDWLPVVDTGGRFALQNQRSGTSYVPTEHALNHIGTIAGIGGGALFPLARDKTDNTKKNKDGEPVVLYARDRRDAEAIVYTLQRTLFAPDRVDQDKPRLFRTWTDGTLRAVLSSQYAIVNNSWVLESIRKIIPGGLLSHWRGDADSIYGNILIPDTIRTESDSDYGGMLSIGNSEIGVRQITTTPSVFRAICMNGCIWDKESGISVNRRHRGEIDLVDLFDTIKCNLEKQIPLLNTGIERMLGIRAFGFDGVPFENIIGQTAQDNRLSVKQTKGLIKEFVEETRILNKDAFSAFGLMNSLTRFGQTLDNVGWIRFDQLAGEMVNQSRESWDKFRSRASQLQPQAVERLLGVSAAA